MVRIWIALFTVFIGYTFYVYNFCDRQAAGATDPRVAKGWYTWQQKNCQACHQLYGLGGYLGPDLTNVAADPYKNELYLKTFIRYGTGKMPDFHLNDSEITNLVAFLRWIDKSGKSRIRQDQVTSSGNYNLDH